MGDYLSIDLDFWLTDFSWYEKRQTKKMYDFLNSLPNVENRLIVDDHHHLLDHINTSSCDTIYHVDYHQDLAFPTRKGERIQLNCGTFFYFVKKRKEKNFKWFCPHSKCWKNQCYGICVDGANPMIKKNWIFKTQSVKTGVPDISNLNITDIGVSLSPEWCCCPNEVVLSAFVHLMEKGFTYTGKFIPKNIQKQLLEV